MAEKDAVSKDFRKQVLGYGLTTAQILYRMPDHPSLLQTYVWQDYDLFPTFPALKDFLAFWEKSLEGPLFAVTRRAFETHQACRTARRRWRLSIALKSVFKAGASAASLVRSNTNELSDLLAK
jgi:uncharacterized protein Usg